MREQLLLLIRVSKPEYNKTLCDDYVLYMNPQNAFNQSGLSDGQYDKYEGVITTEPTKLLYSSDDKRTWHSLGDVTMIKKNNYAYIYCMYGLKYDQSHYNKEENKYYYVIPWNYIKSLWQGNDTEMMVIKNTKVLLDKFERAAEREGLSYAHGKVRYDLDEKLTDIMYYDLAMKDSFESVFHKVKEDYEIQNEVRLAVICPDKPDYYKLHLENDQRLKFTTIPLEYGRDIMVVLSELEFDSENKFPMRFSEKIQYYESEK